MVTDAVAVSLPGLCNKIAHIHNRGFRSVDSVHDIAHDKMRQNAGVQAAGTEKNQITFQNFGDNFFTGMDVVVIAELCDISDVLAYLFFPEEVLQMVFALSDEFHNFFCQRQYGSFDVQ